MRLTSMRLACALTCAFIYATQTHGQGNLPVDKVITDTQGRVTAGTILAIQGDAISFRRSSDNKEFQIQIGILSPEDKAFIQTLATQKPAARTNELDDPENPENPENPKPATRVVLDIPFEEQDRGGICAAAATLNILKFLDPGLKMSQAELLALFNDRRSGASPTQVAIGIETLGFTGTLVETRSADRKLLAIDIKDSIDKGQPMIAATSGHAMVLVGYDVTDKNKPLFFVWNQRSTGNPEKVEGMPPGTEAITEEELPARIRHIMFIRPEKSEKVKKAPVDRPPVQGLQFTYHIVANANSRKETDEEFYRHAAEPAILTHLRRGNRVFIKEIKNRTIRWVEVLKITDNEWNLKPVASEEIITIQTRAGARLLVTSYGGFFSGGSEPIKPIKPNKPD